MVCNTLTIKYYENTDNISLHVNDGFKFKGIIDATELITTVENWLDEQRSRQST